MTAPRVVIDAHARLTAALAERGGAMAVYLEGFADDVRRKSRDTTAGGLGTDRYESMFYPWTDAHLPEGAQRMAGALSRDLFGARTYQITEEITDVLNQYHDSGGQPTDMMREAELPTDAGFVWLDKPLMHHDIHNKVAAIRAVSWAKTWVNAGEDHNHFEHRRAVRIVYYSHAADDDDYHGWLDYNGRRELFIRDVGELSMVHLATIPFSMEITMGPGTQARYDQGNKDSMISFLHAMWAFMQMEITTTRVERPERGARKRAMKSLKHTDVHVVTLRRAKHITEPAGEHRHVDWSCRWIVTAHYRHIDSYDRREIGLHAAQPGRGGEHPACEVCEARTTLVRPYIKGPDGLPLKSAEQLYRLSR